MSRIEKQIASLQKRISILEDRMKQESNLSDIKEMLEDISKGIDKNVCDTKDEILQTVLKRPPSHILQTKFRFV
jgi:hypothetical protein